MNTNCLPRTRMPKATPKSSWAPTCLHWTGRGLPTALTPQLACPIRGPGVHVNGRGSP